MTFEIRDYKRQQDSVAPSTDANADDLRPDIQGRASAFGHQVNSAPAAVGVSAMAASGITDFRPFQIGGAYADSIVASAADADGNTLIIGTIQGTVTVDGVTFENAEGITNATAAFIAKIDAAGNLLWGHSFGNDSNETVTGIAVDATGAAYVTGRFAPRADAPAIFGDLQVPASSTSGTSDGFLFKIDTDGAFQWVVPISGGLSEAVNSVDLTADGNVQIVGVYRTDVDFNPSGDTPYVASTGTTSNQVFIASYDADNGHLVTFRSLAGGGGSATSQAVDSDGNTFIGGQFNGTTDFNPGTGEDQVFALSSQGNDGFLVKLNADHSFAWALSIGSTGALDSVLSITTDNEGSAYITGRFAGTTTFGSTQLTATGNSDSYVAKVSADGEILWVQQFGGAANGDETYAVSADDTGLYVAGKLFGSIKIAGVEVTGNGHDGLVAKLAHDGSLLWVKTFAGPLNDFIYHVQATGDGVTVTGSGGSMDIDPGPRDYGMTTNGGVDGFVFKLDADGNGLAHNYAPEITSSPEYTVAIDDVLLITATMLNHLDQDGDALENVRITSSPTTGTLWNDANGNGALDDGETLSSGSTVSIDDIEAGRLTYTPSVAGSAVAAFSYQVFSGGKWSEPGVASISVSPPATASAPVITASPIFAATEDTALTITLDALNYSDPAGYPLQWIEITRVPGSGTLWLDLDGNGTMSAGEAIAAGQIVNATQILAGSLKYTPALNENGLGVGSFDFTASNGAATSVTASASFSIDAVNDAPTISDALVLQGSGVEARTITAEMLGFSDVDGDALSSITLTAATINGTLWVDTNSNGILDGGETAIATGSVIAAADIEAGRLRHLLTDATANDTFGYTVSDGILSSTAATATILHDADGFPVVTGHGPGNDEGRSVFVDGDGNVYTSGYFTNSITFGDVTLTAAGGNDGYVVKYDERGEVQWAYQVGSSGADYAYSVTADANGNVYVAGEFGGAVDFAPGMDGTGEMTARGTTDSFLLKLDAAGNYVWAKQVGSEGASSTAFGVRTDNDGNVYVSGDFGGSVDFNTSGEDGEETATDGQNFYVAKYSTEGDYAWSQIMQGAIPGQVVVGFTTDAAGNSYITGYYSGVDRDFGGVTLSSAGGDDMFVMKVDTNGETVWARSLGGTAKDHGEHIAVDKDGNVFITGHFAGTMNFDPEGEGATLTASADDGFLLKLRPDGSFGWATQIAGAPGDQEEGYGVVTDDSGDAYVVGWGRFSLWEPETSNGGWEAFVGKFSGEDGSKVWGGKIGGHSSDNAWAVALDDRGHLYVAGSYHSDAGVDMDPTPGKHYVNVEYLLGTTNADGYARTYDSFVLKLNTADGTIAVANLAPLVEDRASSATEGEAIVLNAETLGYSDPDETGPLNVTIVSPPSSGALTLDGVAVIAGQRILAADIEAGKLSFTPDGDASTISLTYWVDDGLNRSALATFTAEINRLPVITSNGGRDEAVVGIAENATLVTLLAATDPEGGTLTFSISGGEDASLFELRNGNELHFKTAPDHENLPSDGDISGYQVVVQVSDGSGGIASQTITVAVVNLSDESPVVSEPVALVALEEDTSRLITQVELLANASDPDGDTLSVVDLTASSGTLVDNSDGTWTFTPAAHDDTEVTFSFSVSDGVSPPVETTATLDLLPVNDAAMISGALTGSVTEDSKLTASGQLTVADPDYGEESFQAGTLTGAYGSLVLTAAGAWTYTLDNAHAAVQALDAGEALTDAIEIRSADGTVATIFITIDGTDDITVNIITGNDESEVINGTEQNDVITPGLGLDIVNAGQGDDVIKATAGDDFNYYDGGSGSDTIDYSAITSSVTVHLGANPFGLVMPGATGAASGGQIGIDLLTSIENAIGGSGNDTLNGDSQANRLEGGAGNDRLNGGAGDDVLQGGAGADKLNGGAGIDIASYADATEGVTANLLNAKLNTGDAAGDTYSSIEGLSGSAFDDILVGNASANILRGGTGADVLIGNGRADKLYGGIDTDVDTFLFNAINDGGGATKASATATGDLIFDFVSGIDKIGISRAGFKIAQDVDLGAGGVLDFASEYFVSEAGAAPTKGNQSGVTATRTGHGQFLFNQTTKQLWWDANGAGKRVAVLLATLDTNIVATDFDLRSKNIAVDGTALGTYRSESFKGVGASDTVSYADATGAVVTSLASAKANTGFAAGDTYMSIENLRGSAFDDKLTGDTFDNILEGGAGADKLNGGKGFDTASYAHAGTGVTADLLKAKNNLGEALGDTYKSIENLLGSSFDDTLVGNNKANTIDGGAGDDVLIGNKGIDILIGGLGADTFRFNTTKDGGGATGDIITDFVSGEDQIGILRSGFKIGATVSEADFLADYFVSDVGNAATASGVLATATGHGQFLFNEDTNQLWWDADGVGKKTAVLLTTFQNGAHLLASDFDLV